MCLCVRKVKEGAGLQTAQDQDQDQDQPQLLFLGAGNRIFWPEGVVRIKVPGSLHHSELSCCASKCEETGAAGSQHRYYVTWKMSQRTFTFVISKTQVDESLSHF